MSQPTEQPKATLEPGGRKVINSVQRAVGILGVFEHNGRELGTTEIADLLGLYKSTAAGLIYTLERNGFLARNLATRKCHLGLRLVELGSLVLGQLDIRRVARPNHGRRLTGWGDQAALHTTTPAIAVRWQGWFGIERLPGGNHETTTRR